LGGTSLRRPQRSLDYRQVENAIPAIASADKTAGRDFAVVSRNSRGVPVVHVDVQPSGKAAAEKPGAVEIGSGRKRGRFPHVRAGENMDANWTTSP